MRIERADVALASQRHAVERREQQESYRVWVGNSPTNGASAGGGVARLRDALTLSEEARQRLAAASTQAQASSPTAGAEADQTSALPPKLLLLVRVLEAMTGQKITVMDPQEAAAWQQAPPTPPATTPAATPTQTRAGWGLVYDARITHYQAEQTSFAASGTVRTRDGRELDFSLQLNMGRTSVTEEQVSFRAGDAALTDPLVLSFTGGAADLSGPLTDFDLDADGQAERIATPGSGSGFLALDRNQDGRVTDGRELFGPGTGDGFAELAAYDQDGNGWIDADDSVFDDLVVWTKGTEGDDRLESLAALGVGALYLGRARTEFSLFDRAEVLQGQVRTSGLFLTEEGRAGALQQVDLAAQPAAEVA